MDDALGIIIVLLLVVVILLACVVHRLGKLLDWSMRDNTLWIEICGQYSEQLNNKISILDSRLEDIEFHTRDAKDALSDIKFFTNAAHDAYFRREPER